MTLSRAVQRVIDSEPEDHAPVALCTFRGRSIHSWHAEADRTAREFMAGFQEAGDGRQALLRFAWKWISMKVNWAILSAGLQEELDKPHLNIVLPSNSEATP